MCDVEKAIDAYDREQLELDRSKLKACNKPIGYVREEINEVTRINLDKICQKYIDEFVKNPNDPSQYQELNFAYKYNRFLKKEMEI